jgi:hypothetical protein
MLDAPIGIETESMILTQTVAGMGYVRAADRFPLAFYARNAKGIKD